jgi:hypothetical protein
LAALCGGRAVLFFVFSTLAFYTKNRSNHWRMAAGQILLLLLNLFVQFCQYLGFYL